MIYTFSQTVIYAASLINTCRRRESRAFVLLLLGYLLVVHLLGSRSSAQEIIGARICYFWHRQTLQRLCSSFDMYALVSKCLWIRSTRRLMLLRTNGGATPPTSHRTTQRPHLQHPPAHLSINTTAASNASPQPGAIPARPYPVCG